MYVVPCTYGNTIMLDQYAMRYMKSRGPAIVVYARPGLCHCETELTSALGLITPSLQLLLFAPMVPMQLLICVHEHGIMIKKKVHGRIYSLGERLKTEKL